MGTLTTSSLHISIILYGFSRRNILYRMKLDFLKNDSQRKKKIFEFLSSRCVCVQQRKEVREGRC